MAVAWLPGPFLAREAVRPGLEPARATLAPGGWLVFGLYAPPSDDPLGAALTALRIVRSGGHPWAAHEVEDLFRAAGLAEVETCAAGLLVLVIGRRRDDGAASAAP